MACLGLIFILVSLIAPISFAWPYGQQQIRGVNLGGWLVLEKWITPQLFRGLPDWVADEYQLCRYLGHKSAEKKLKQHWDSWVTEQDIIDLKNMGINHIRIPIGYWALNIRADEPWVWGSWQKVIQACGWAKKHGLQVMIDLHGAPGSQNGEDHSGQKGEIRWYYSQDHIDRTVQVLGQIARFANAREWRDTISIIQLLNEPILWNDYDFRLQTLKNFYRKAYDEIRRYNDIAVIAVHDAFIPLNNWFYLRNDPHYFWVMLDNHHYQLSADMKNLTCNDHNYVPCRKIRELRESNQKLWTIVGEFSLATPNNCDNQQFFARQQIGVYERVSGWFMWNFKHGNGWIEWDFMASVRKGWINLHSSNNAVC